MIIIPGKVECRNTNIECNRDLELTSMRHMTFIMTSIFFSVRSYCISGVGGGCVFNFLSFLFLPEVTNLEPWLNIGDEFRDHCSNNNAECKY